MSKDPLDLLGFYKLPRWLPWVTITGCSLIAVAFLVSGRVRQAGSSLAIVAVWFAVHRLRLLHDARSGDSKPGHL
jgi:hypothetical protein